MTAENAVLRSTFNPLVRRYMIAYVAWVLLMTIIFSPLIVIWLLGPGQWWASHYYRRLKCELDDRFLNFRKGILFQVEKTIPLENIQDVTFIEGPLLRQFNLSIIRIETAGQSPGQAHNMQLVGIVDAHLLRAEILRRRELARRHVAPTGTSAGIGDERQLEALIAIRARLDEIAALLHARDRNDGASS